MTAAQVARCAARARRAASTRGPAPPPHPFGRAPAAAAAAAAPASAQLCARSIATSAPRALAASPLVPAPAAGTVIGPGASAKPEVRPGIGVGGKQRLVIVGSGWGGSVMQRELDMSKYEVHLISPNPNFTMTPLLAQAAVGTLDFRAVTEPVTSSEKLSFHRAWVDKVDIENKVLELTSAAPPAFREVDPLLPPEEQQLLTVPSFSEPKHAAPTAQHARPMSQQTAHMSTATSTASSAAVAPAPAQFLPTETASHRTTSTLKFDKLVLSMGSYNRTFNTPGVKQNALFLKDVNNGRQIRWRIVSCLEQANNPALSIADKQKLLTWIVVGGGPTGSELIGELTDLVNVDIRKRFPSLVPLIKLILVDAGKKILSSFDAELADYAREHFVSGRVDVRLERHITGVSPGVLHIQEDGDIPYGMLVWSTGVTASPLTRSIQGIAKDSRGLSLLTDDRLHALKAPQGEEQVPLLPVKPDFSETTKGETGEAVPKYDAYEDIFVIGDAGVVQGEWLPATAQVAKAKAKYVAAQLNADLGHVRACDMPPEPSDDTAKALRGRAPEPQPFAFQSKGQMSSLGSHAAIFQNTGWRGRLNMVKGPPAWALWRSAYSLLSSNRNRLAVPFGWFLKMLFGRDLSRF